MFPKQARAICEAFVPMGKMILCLCGESEQERERESKREQERERERGETEREREREKERKKERPCGETQQLTNTNWLLSRLLSSQCGPKILLTNIRLGPHSVKYTT